MQSHSRAVFAFVGIGLLTAAQGQLVTTNLLINPGAETGDLSGWTIGGDSNPFAGAPTNSLNDGFPTHSGNNYFVGGTGSFGSLSQMVSLVGNQGITASLIDSGNVFATVSFWEQGLNQGGTNDNANVSLKLFDAATNLLQSISTPVIDSANNSWQNYSGNYAIPSLTRFIQYTMNFYRNVGNDLDAFIDDNSLQVTASLPVITAAYTWTTFAGRASGGNVDGVGTDAQFRSPNGVAVDVDGNLYVADTFNYTIRRITPAGIVSTIAGLAGFPGSADGIGSRAQFGGPVGVALDSTGSLFVSDTYNHTIRKMTPTGTNWIVSTLAGLAGTTGTNDGTGSDARFYLPAYVAVGTTGTVYVTDNGNYTIRKMTPTGTNWGVTTIAGLAGVPGSTDATGSNARFRDAEGIAVDGAEQLYVADAGANDEIRKITPMGGNWSVTTLAGLTGNPGTNDGTGTSARFNNPLGIVADFDGNSYVADTGNDTIRKIAPGAVVGTLAGLATNAGAADGTGNHARFNSPQGITVDHFGNLYVSDTFNTMIRKVTAAGVVTTIAGSAGSAGNADGNGSRARFNKPDGVALDAMGNLYLADAENHTIRKVTPAGVASTIAGLAGNPGSADGAGDNARFNFPHAVTVDLTGNLYVADTFNYTIRKITPAGVVSTIAGIALNSGANDGIGPFARFNLAYGIAVDSAMNLYVADTYGHTIRKLVLAGGSWQVSTIAGVAYSSGSADGVGSNAHFNYPYGIGADSAGNLFVADSINCTIRKLTPAGPNWMVSTIAGSVMNVGHADGAGINAQFFNPQGLAVDTGGNLYVADTANYSIRKISQVGINWVVSTCGGLPEVFGSDDGAGSKALFDNPSGIAVDNVGNLFVTDSENNTIRKGVFSAYTPTNPVPYTPPPMTAQLIITLLPHEANGQWRFPWEFGWRNSGQATSNLVAGNYPVEFRSLPGWLAIPPRLSSVQVTNGGPTPITTNVYYPTLIPGGANSGAGSLTVNLGPTPPSGAGWRFLGDIGDLLPSGYTTNLLPGTYLIEFAGPFSGRSTPSTASVKVLAGQPTVLSVNYPLSDSAPGGVLLPIPVPPANINNLNDYPFGFNGQLQSDVGYGSGVAVLANVVLTAAHLVFNDQTMSYVSQVYWFFQEETGLFMPQPQAARGWYILSSYSAQGTNSYAIQRTNDLMGLGGQTYGPDQSSAESRNLDVAALFFPSAVAGGGYGGYLPSDEVPNAWLSSTSLKMLVGYPVDGSLFGSNVILGRMYQTDPQRDVLSLSTDQVNEQQQVYAASWFLSYPGNSGGPFYVQFNGYYYPAGVYLGTLYNGSGYRSVVRAIDSGVVNLIAVAARDAGSGTNNTGGGVITIIPGAVSASNPGYLQFQLAPPAAVQQGAAWRLQGDTSYSMAVNYTRAVTSTNAFAVEFKPIPGWNTPTNQSLTVQPGLITPANAFYTVINPVLVADLSLGLGITGTTGTTYRIESRNSLSAGTWLALSTNTITATGINQVLPSPPTSQPTTYYRALWLQQ